MESVAILMSEEAVYTTLDSSAIQDVDALIPKSDKRFQLLHHAFIYQARTAVLLIGDNTKLFYGVITEFDQQLFEAYDRIILFLCKNYLDQFYGGEEGLPSRSKVEAILAADAFKMKKLDYDSYKTNLLIWRCVNISPGQAIKFPLPPCSRILPIQHAFWNILKPVSDTFTKNADHCKASLGVLTPQSKAFACMLMHYFNGYYRSIQIVSSKDDLKSYTTLGHFRDAAKHRVIFHGALLDLKCQLFMPKASKSSTLLPSPLSRATQGSSLVKGVKLAFECVGIMPGKGRSRKLKYPTVEDAAFQQQCRECVGLTLVAVNKTDDRGRPLSDDKFDAKRMKCAVCGQHTHYLCTWYKRYLCTNKVRAPLLNKSRTPTDKLHPFLRTSQERWDGTKMAWQQEDLLFVNSCYIIAHKEQLDRYWEKKCLQPMTLEQIHGGQVLAGKLQVAAIDITEMDDE